MKVLDAHVIRGTPEQCTVPALGIAAANRKPCYWLKDLWTLIQRRDRAARRLGLGIACKLCCKLCCNIDRWCGRPDAAPISLPRDQEFSKAVIARNLERIAEVCIDLKGYRNGGSCAAG